MKRWNLRILIFFTDESVKKSEEKISNFSLWTFHASDIFETIPKLQSTHIYARNKLRNRAFHISNFLFLEMQYRVQLKIFFPQHSIFPHTLYVRNTNGCQKLRPAPCIGTKMKFIRWNYAMKFNAINDATSIRMKRCE